MTRRSRSWMLALALTSLALSGCDDGDGVADGGDAGEIPPGEDGGAGDAGPPAESCSDGMMNQDETDVDCGGVCGATCMVGEMCTANGDCGSDICDMGTCQPMPTCDDGVQNGMETDIDCGGMGCSPCDNGGLCMVDADCVSMFCDAGECVDPTCGNGLVEGAAEECDEGVGGTPTETATCDVDCTSVMCGDGVTNMTAGEGCDGDGMGTGGETATCNADCTPAACGDGMINAAAGEDCDDGVMGVATETATCDIDCTSVMCGDGVANTAAGEQCDDGNMDDTDACSNSCTVNAQALNITLNATFDTDTGELDGVVYPGWVPATGTVNVTDFSLATGVIFTITGTAPFDLSATGTIDVQGTIVAAGQDGTDDGGCDSTTNGLGGAGGPGGGAGGDGAIGGSPSPDYSGQDGMGPGAGGGGQTDTAGGGGAGHRGPGLPGDALVAANAGAPGAAYGGPAMSLGGSGGGGGSGDNDSGSGDDPGGGGGGGGGYVGLTAAGAITIGGTIDVSGGDGGNTTCAGNGGSGGGGSGGSIVLASGPGLDISTATFDVSGGLGGTASRTGGDGADGVVVFTGGCMDGVDNQDETDVDCGGSCAPCALGAACLIDGDCVSGGACLMGFCQLATCGNMTLDGMETDVDCGGAECAACADGLMCVADSDCMGTGCDTGVCASCVDGARNDEESDVDCGGTECSACADGLMCGVNADCTSLVCTGGVCQAPTCSDSTVNQDETDVDCGGATCAGCATGLTCTVATDCASGVCTGGVCQAPTCSDGVANGGETDVDCGGATACPRCMDRQRCTAASDCTAGVCTTPPGRCGTFAGCNIGLIAQETQFSDATIQGLLTAEGHLFTVLNNNGTTGVHSADPAVVAPFDIVVYHQHDRVMSATELTTLTNYVMGGGRVIVTGYDSLGSPTDSVLAGFLQCTAPGDGPFADTLSVELATHPILMGPAETFTMGQALTSSSTDHDQCTPAPGAQRLVSVGGTSSKLNIAEGIGPNNGMVVYWNGNGVGTGALTDWTGASGSQPSLQNLFVNTLDYLCRTP